MTTETKVQHSPEPWALVEQFDEGKRHGADITGADGYLIEFAPYDDEHFETDRANTRRKVAAVNAYKGIPTEAFEQIDLLEVICIAEQSLFTELFGVGSEWPRLKMNPDYKPEYDRKRQLLECLGALAKPEGRPNA